MRAQCAVKQEHIGTLSILGAAFTFSAYPILGTYGVDFLHPLFLGAAMAVCATLLTAPLLIKQGNVSLLFTRHMPHLFLIGFFATAFTTAFLFYGVRFTSGINAALLMQVEPLYTLVFGYLFLNERVTQRQLFWTIIVVLGAGLVAYSGSFTVNPGDLLVLAAPLGGVIGNLYAKKLEDVDAATLVTGRFFYAGLVLAVVAAAVDAHQFHLLTDWRSIGTVLVLGGASAGGILLFYHGLKQVNLSKAVAVLLPAAAVGSLIFAWPILGEVPNTYQVTGGLLIMIGVYHIAQMESQTRA